MTHPIPLRAPFPYFGGKARASSLVWQRFGEVVNFVEPFFGSGAVLLSCPDRQRPRVETVNDVNAFVCNFWRAVKADAEAVAGVADYPVIETDLHVRHRWLLAQAAGLRERLDGAPDHFDAKIAGWWVWGASAWIGSGWCEAGRAPAKQAPALVGGGGENGSAYLGKGIHAAGMREPSRQLPALGGATAKGEPMANHDAGVHAAGARAPSRQLPHLVAGSNGGRPGPDPGKGIHSAERRTALYDIFAALAERLRYVRVACGDWSRICTPAVTYRHGLTAVFLDPPYDGFEHLYGATEEHAEPLSARVRAWALEHGERPDMRIALCGYEGEHDMLGWECVAWKAKGGYGNHAADGDNDNARRERIWFSPACLRPGVNVGQIDLFARANGAAVKG